VGSTPTRSIFLLRGNYGIILGSILTIVAQKLLTMPSHNI
jgi:hypothetical protein